MEHYLNPHLNNRKITGLIENRTTYTSSNAELNIFETFEEARDIQLNFPYPIIVAMIAGKKRMKLPETEYFSFLPGETVIVPEKHNLNIDFPEASLKNPTQCLTLGIDPLLIHKTLNRHNEIHGKSNQELYWDLSLIPTHIKNNVEIQNLLHRMVYTFTSDSLFKDSLLEIMLQELILRILQEHIQDSNQIYIQESPRKNRLSKVITYINTHIAEKSMSIEKLADLACLSPSHFHKVFKKNIGLSPVDFINKKRIELAKKMLLGSKSYKISTVAYLSGFNNVGYFNRIFKKYTSMTPSEFIQKSNRMG